MLVTSKLFPQNLFLQNIFFKTISSIILIRLYSAYDMFNRYNHAYQINQEKSAEITF